MPFMTRSGDWRKSAFLAARSRRRLAIMLRYRVLRKPARCTKKRPRVPRRESAGSRQLPRRRCVLPQLVADDPAALHHELDALELGDVCARIAGNRDEIGIFAFLDRTDLILPPQRLGVDDGGGLDCARGT